MWGSGGSLVEGAKVFAVVGGKGFSDSVLECSNLCLGSRLGWLPRWQVFEDVERIHCRYLYEMRATPNDNKLSDYSGSRRSLQNDRSETTDQKRLRRSSLERMVRRVL